MYNPLVPLLAIAATAGTVFASDTPTTRSYWTKVNGTWTYMPEVTWKSMANTQPTGMPKIVLPLSQVPPVNLTVLPRWLKGAREAIGKREVVCGEKGDGFWCGKKWDNKEEKEEEKRAIKDGEDEICTPLGPPDLRCDYTPKVNWQTKVDDDKKEKDEEKGNNKDGEEEKEDSKDEEED